MMEYFTAIPESAAITYARGIYRQVALFERGGKVYAKQGSGYVRLMQGGATSNPNVRWADTHVVDGNCVELAGHVEYRPILQIETK